MSTPADGDLDRALVEAGRLVATASGVALALADIGIDLPQPAATDADGAQLRALGGLYLAAELDAAGLIAAAEALASLSSAGGVPFALGSAAAEVAAFWRVRRDRATAAERAALFSTLFGQDTGTAAADHPGNEAFQFNMIELSEALYKLDEQGERAWGGVAAQTRVRRAAAALIESLTRAAGGLTVFMAEDLIATLKQALAIFRHDDLRAVLRARDTWAAVAAALRLARMPATEAARHAQRARAGMTVIAWLADAAPHLGTPGPLVALDHPVIPAAVEWLEVSLSIGEAAAAPPAAEPRRSWAALAA